MVNTSEARVYESVLVALDLSDASANAMHSARSLGLLENARITVVHAFDAVAKSMLALADVPSERIFAYVKAEQERAASELQSYLSVVGSDVDVILRCRGRSGFSYLQGGRRNWS